MHVFGLLFSPTSHLVGVAILFPFLAKILAYIAIYYRLKIEVISISEKHETHE